MADGSGSAEFQGTRQFLQTRLARNLTGEKRPVIGGTSAAKVARKTRLFQTEGNRVLYESASEMKIAKSASCIRRTPHEGVFPCARERTARILPTDFSATLVILIRRVQM